MGRERRRVAGGARRSWPAGRGRRRPRHHPADAGLRSGGEARMARGLNVREECIVTNYEDMPARGAGHGDWGGHPTHAGETITRVTHDVGDASPSEALVNRRFSVEGPTGCG